MITINWMITINFYYIKKYFQSFSISIMRYSMFNPLHICSAISFRTGVDSILCWHCMVNPFRQSFVKFFYFSQVSTLFGCQKFWKLFNLSSPLKCTDPFSLRYSRFKYITWISGMKNSHYYWKNFNYNSLYLFLATWLRYLFLAFGVLRLNCT